MSPIPNTPPENGACKGHDVEMWFPLRDMKRTRDFNRKVDERSAEAKAICMTCEVREKCLEYSLYYEPYGIWGGLDEQERHRIRLRKGIRAFRNGFVSGVAGSRRVNSHVPTHK